MQLLTKQTHGRHIILMTKQCGPYFVEYNSELKHLCLDPNFADTFYIFHISIFMSDTTMKNNYQKIASCVTPKIVIYGKQ